VYVVLHLLVLTVQALLYLNRYLSCMNPHHHFAENNFHVVYAA
jgi:hypothetical protein